MTDKPTAKTTRRFVIRVPHITSHPLQFAVPEFMGTSEGKRFAVRQMLNWEPKPNEKGQQVFHLEGKPEDIGYKFFGSIAVASEDSLAVQMVMENYHKKELHNGHHSALLKINPKSEFIDFNGENTFLYTDAGWLSLSQMVRNAKRGRVRDTFRQGANYGGNTLIWRIIARMDRDRRKLIAVAMDRGYAFASNHPEWDPGLLIGCRWGTLYPREPETCNGKVYFLPNNSLSELERRYAADFR